MASSNLPEMVPGGGYEPQLEKARHIKYWTRNLKTLLPHHYTGLDSNRMYLGYFILAAMDLLDVLERNTTPEERTGYLDWIYSCQHPHGGFRMWRGTYFGEHATKENAKWDPANVPATYFALVALLILNDDFKRVKRKETVQWIRTMQRKDGSFGETLVDGQIEGGRDPRFGYCATGVRYILRGTKPGPLDVDGDTVEDIDVDSLVDCILAAESYDGGIADEPFHEPHAGYTFCSLGALDFIGRLRTTQTQEADVTLAPTNPQGVLRWLVHRQTDHLYPDSTLDSEFIAPTKSSVLNSEEVENICTTSAPAHDQEGAQQITAIPSAETSPPIDFNARCAGMNGRLNKIADTCYAWWSGASIHILGHPAIYDTRAVRKYLLEKTQHPILGGFGKFPGDLPDLYHSYLGLAALSLAGSKEVKEVDAGMCVSKEARGRLKSLWEGWGVEGSP